MHALNICVMGLGYIGLPTASVLATRGHQVLGVDVDAHVVSQISQGEIHIQEPDLDVLVRSSVGSGNLRASTTPRNADVFILAVPTPFQDAHQPDLSYVDAATRAIAPHLSVGVLVVLESTSPVGTTERIATLLEELRPDLCQGGRSFHVAHCPERVLPGRILHEIVDNDRVVGGVDAGSTARAVAFYRSFVTGEVLGTDARTAEMCKLVENASRDVSIAFANELSVLCDRFGIDVWRLIELANRHPRVEILRPGPGVGGHCIAVDPWFLISAHPDASPLMQAARQVNTGKEAWVVEQVLRHAARFRAPKVACLGLAYKPNVDDLRESPAVAIARQLVIQLGESAVCCVEPNKSSVDGLELVELDDALETADIVVALVAHRQFSEIDGAKLHSKILVDTCGMF